MNDSEFDDLLRMSRDPVLLPPSFQQGVWSRIESADLDDPQEIVKFQPVVVALTRPWSAVASIAAMVTLGLWVGAATAPEARDAKVAYAESISPFAQEHSK
ncbi:MAG: hypothetical protein ABI600_03275 [Luteolibacter sp.]